MVVLTGYYADLDTRCQVFHICSKMPDNSYIQSSFLCPNGTIFQQESFSCQWSVFSTKSISSIKPIYLARDFFKARSVRSMLGKD